MSDLTICRVYHWPYDVVRSLPRDVYDVLVDDLNRPPPDET